jgi:two-component sensor histidine kinase
MKILHEKICALSRASDAAFSLPDSDGLDASRAELGSLVCLVLQPYGDRCRTIGEQQISIGWSNTTTLALVMHELATNSVKYGALSTEKGNVAIDWAVAGEGIDLAWVENGGPTISALPTVQGFGTEMLDRIVRSQGGGIDRPWNREGLTARLYLPNPD